MTGLVEGQRQLAERMAAWADLHRQFADVLTALLGPLADTGRHMSHGLDQVSGKLTPVPGQSPPAR